MEVAVDVALLTVRGGGLAALLVERAEPPQRGRWELPGGFVRQGEPVDAAAHRVLAVVGQEQVFVEQLYTFGRPDRDPRRRAITVAHYALVPLPRLDAARRDADVLAQLDVPWAGEAGGPVAAVDAERHPLDLAFDHAEILGMAVLRLRGKLAYAPVGFALLGERFPLRALQDVHEAVRGVRLNTDSFRRRMLASGQLVATGERERDVDHRPAELYRLLPPTRS